MANRRQAGGVGGGFYAASSGPGGLHSPQARYPHAATDELSADELTDDGSNIYEQANPPPGVWSSAGGAGPGAAGYGPTGQSGPLGSLVPSLTGSQRYAAHQPPNPQANVACHNQIITRKTNGTALSGSSGMFSLCIWPESAPVSPAIKPSVGLIFGPGFRTYLRTYPRTYLGWRLTRGHYRT